MTRLFCSLLVLSAGLVGCGGHLAADATEDAGAHEDAGAQEDAGAHVDGGSSVTPPTSGEPIDIASLPGLLLWLESTKDVEVDDGHVKNWLDQSPEHNNLALYKGQGATVGTDIGDVQTISFDGASVYSLPFDSALDEWNGDFLVEIVLRMKNTGSVQAFLSCAGTPPNVPGFTRAIFYVDGSDSECSVDSDGFTNESYTEPLGDDAVLVGYYRSGDVIEARHNGGLDLVTSGLRVTAPSCAKTVFGASLTENMQDDENYFASQVAEIVVVHGPTSDATVANVEQTLLAKYAIH